MIVNNPNTRLVNGVLYFDTTPTLANGIVDISASPTLGANTAVKTKVELYADNVLLDTCTCHDRILELAIERTGQNNKFFGFGILHKLTIKLLDLNRTLNVVKGNTFKVYAGYDAANMIKPYPTFYVDDVSRDEATSVITITAYDALYEANNITINDVNQLFLHFEETETGLQEVVSYTTLAFLQATTNVLKINSIEMNNISPEASCFITYYPKGANFSGDESYKLGLDAVAEATQCVYYINNNDNLVFKRLNKTGSAVITITEANKIALTTGETCKLTTIVNATELGDNLAATTGEEGKTQYLRNNPFLELREDLSSLLDAAIDAVGGLEITPFYCNYIGNFLVEPADKIDIITNGNNKITTFVLCDYINFNGTLIEASEWTFEADEETEANPSNIGDAIKKTYAKVNKVNQRIDLVVSDTDNKIAELNLTAEGINASVQSLEQTTQEQLQNANENYEKLVKEVSLKMTDEAVQIAISKELEKGTNKVATSTGFTFDENGLTIEKADSEISTNIDENGLSVFKNNDEVLTADNAGVKAKNLHATTYLIVGQNTYFADYEEGGETRAGAFWTGK